MKKRILHLDKELLVSSSVVDAGRVGIWGYIITTLIDVSIEYCDDLSRAICPTVDQTCAGSDCNGTCGTCATCVSVCQCFTDAC